MCSIRITGYGSFQRLGDYMQSKSQVPKAAKDRNENKNENVIEKQKPAKDIGKEYKYEFYRKAKTDQLRPGQRIRT